MGPAREIVGLCTRVLGAPQGNAAYEAKVGRTGATAGEVPVLQADSTLAFETVGGVTDHGALTGLSDDDRPQYVLAAGDTMTGTLLVPDGTVSAPAIGWSADSDSGLYRVGGNAIGVTTGGSLAAKFFNDTALPGGIQVADGRTVATAVGFINDVDTGIVLTTSNSLGIVAGSNTVVNVVTPASGTVYLGAGSDGNRDLGAAAARFKDIYATNATINTSDETQKNSIQPTPVGKDFVRRVEPKEFVFNDGERPHQGFVAQQVKDVLTALGIADSAAYVDPAINAAKREQAGPPPQTEDQTDEEYADFVAQWQAEIDAEKAAPKGLRYSELIPPLYKALQEQQVEIDELRSENDTLKATVADFVARVEALEASK